MEKPSSEERPPRSSIHVGNHTLYYFNEKTLFLIDLKSQNIEEIASNSLIDCFAISPDEKYFAIGNQKEFQIYEKDQKWKEIYKQ